MKCKHGYDARLCPHTHDNGLLDPLSPMLAGRRDGGQMRRHTKGCHRLNLPPCICGLDAARAKWRLTEAPQSGGS